MRAILCSGLLALVVGCSLAGCAVTSNDGRRMGLKSDAYSEYVESVFQLQSEVSTELAFVLDAADPDSERYLALEDAELDILTACRGLNELASEQRSRSGAGGFAAMKRARQVPDCERAARQGAATLAD